MIPPHKHTHTHTHTLPFASFQNFDKVESFLKPALNICIPGNLIVGWGGWVINKETSILHHILDLVNVLTFAVAFIKVRDGIL